jgi:uncharacterized repeat protein (TIGR01451 family)
MLGTTTFNRWQWGALGFCLSLSTVTQADISGSVFRDFNANGSFDSSASFAELGMAGVTVKAFDSAGAVAATASSNATGAYTLTGLTADAPYRLEFSWAESWLKPGAAGGTSTQFVKDGASNVNLALSSPEEYSQDNPQVATSIFLLGEPTSPEVSGKAGVLEFASRSGALGRDFADTLVVAPLVDEQTDIAISSAPSSAGTGNAAPPTMAGRSKILNATLDQIGPVYGLAYQRSANQLLAAAFMKRFVGFPGGTSNIKLGTIYKIDRNSNPNTVTPFYTANAGTDSHDYSRSDLNSPSGDQAAGDQVSKAGWGDIDLSADGKTLYAVNLFDKNIYAIPVTGSGSAITAGTANLISFPSTVSSGLCSNNEWVPGGVKTYRNDVYVTVTCTAETSQAVSDLKFVIYKFPQSDPTNFTQVTSMGAPVRQDGVFNQQWQAWTNTTYLNGTPLATDEPRRYIYPQPWAMDIEFDEFGKIYLGLRNRSSDMRAPFNDQNQPAFEYGDTEVGIPNGDGSYTMLTGGGTPPYEYIDDNTNEVSSAHTENDMGSLAVIPGTKEIMVPATIGNLIEGIRTYSTVDATTTAARSGVPVRYYGLVRSEDTINTGNSFGKTAGLGDLEVLSAPAPIELGNRVWVDTDKDGIQDADEVGLSGVNVSLVCASNSASTSTDANGQFIFSNASGGNATFMKPEDNCTLQIDNTQTALKTYQLTASNADADSSNSALTDLRDSDAALKGNLAEISFQVGASGENNHSLDFGYKVALTDVALSKTVAPTEAKRGDQVVYTLTITNQSTTTEATNVSIAEQLPASVTYVSDDGATQFGSDVFDEATGVWNVGSVAAGASKTLKITVQLK